MDAFSFFMTRYADLHGSTTDRLLEGLTEAQLRLRPHPAVNTIAWLLWHVARCEDVGVNRFVDDQPQVLDAEGWLPRLAVGRRDIGTEMDDAEVDALSAAVDLAALRGYWAAVGRRTLAVVEGLRADELDAVSSAEQARQVVFDEGAAGDKAAWLERQFTGRTKGWFLAQFALTHTYGHFAEARVVKGLFGLGTIGKHAAVAASDRPR
jgi:DinB family protein